MKLKPTANSFRNLVAVLLPMVFVSLSSLAAAPVFAPAGTNIVQSVFVLPDSPKEGRDPFFPSSIRPYKDRVPAGLTPVSSLKLEGITRARGKVFVIINGVTFGVGDEDQPMRPAFSKNGGAPRGIYSHASEFGKKDLASAIFLAILATGEKIGVKP